MPATFFSWFYLHLTNLHLCTSFEDVELSIHNKLNLRKDVTILVKRWSNERFFLVHDMASVFSIPVLLAKLFQMIDIDGRVIVVSRSTSILFIVFIFIFAFSLDLNLETRFLFFYLFLFMSSVSNRYKGLIEEFFFGHHICFVLHQKWHLSVSNHHIFGIFLPYKYLLKVFFFF